MSPADPSINDGILRLFVDGLDRLASCCCTEYWKSKAPAFRRKPLQDPADVCCLPVELIPFAVEEDHVSAVSPLPWLFNVSRLDKLSHGIRRGRL